ncbi:MAG TPA: glycosyltransferase family 9 protein [Bryobacteraceae bacterium]|nr:glycosyltransferase family 9 protein [Bryobacteraceae bacterium]
MASISCNELAGRLLACCLNGEHWPPDLLDRLLAPDCADALIRIVVERLADLFEPRLCDIYAELFSEAIARSIPELNAADLIARYRRIRAPRRVQIEPATVFVLSRVTLGADVAVTSVLLDAAKRRFPRARIVLAGGRKSWELFAADPRIDHASISYRRTGSLRDRLGPWTDLRQLLSQPDSIVIDPDSRLTQLGLLPVSPEEDYYFFESRAYGGDGDDPLPVLTARWAREIMDVEDAAPYIAPAELPEIPGRPFVTMSLGVGENPAKRIADPFEQQLVAHLASRAAHVLIDQGAGGEEAERVERAVASSRSDRIRRIHGSFAAFASLIASSDLYIGYDSAGQHVAAACGVPLVSIFTGFASPRMLARWRPSGKGPMEVIAVSGPESPLASTVAAVDKLLARGPRRV